MKNIPLLLAIDAGNTNITIGLYQDRQLLCHWRLATEPERTADEYGLFLQQFLARRGFTADTVTAVAMTSVVPAAARALGACCRDWFGIDPLVAGSAVATGIAIACDRPDEVGTDRIVNAAAAYHRYQQALIVVDFGTAITFDCVTGNDRPDGGSVAGARDGAGATDRPDGGSVAGARDGAGATGRFLGGAIAPGIAIARDALAGRTARLPRVDLTQPPASPIGRNTADAIKSGLLYGFAGLVEGMTARMVAAMAPEKPLVVATGGMAELIAAHCRAIDTVVPFLTLDGLLLLHDLNPALGRRRNS